MKRNVERIYQAPVHFSLKKAFLFFALVFCSLVLFSQNHSEQTPVDRKEIQIAAKFGHIEVRGDVSIVFSVALGTNEIAVEGASKDITRIRTSVKSNWLIIDATAKTSFTKTIIYVPVSEATSIRVIGDAEITAEDIIQANRVDISLNGASYVDIKSSGKINITAADGYDLVYGRHYKP